MKINEMIKNIIKEIKSDEWEMRKIQRAAIDMESSIENVIIGSAYCRITRGMIKKYQLEMHEINEYTNKKLLKYQESNNWSAKQRGMDILWIPTNRLYKMIMEEIQEEEYISLEREAIQEGL